jgi:trypsin-like peptidase
MRLPEDRHKRLRRLFQRILLIFSLSPLLSLAAAAQEGISVNTRIVPNLPVLSDSRIINLCTPGILLNSQVRWSRLVASDSSTPWLRLHFVLSQDRPDADWEIEIVDSDGTVAQVIRSQQIRISKSTGVRDFWSDKLLTQDYLTVNLKSNIDMSGIHLCVDRYNFDRPLPGIKAVIGTDDREELLTNYGLNHRFYRYGSPVGAIFFLDPRTAAETNCTGFLVAPTIFLTNYHCISEDTQLTSASIRFHYDSESVVGVQTVQPIEILAANEELDYVFLRTNSALPVVAELAEVEPQRNEALIVVQHPRGHPKWISVKKCRVWKTVDPGRLSDFYHLCDTSDGSSGSPIMDEVTGLVVGLHHLGEIDDHSHTVVNLGVRIRRILSQLKVDKPVVYQEVLTARSKSGRVGN